MDRRLILVNEAQIKVKECMDFLDADHQAPFRHIDSRLMRLDTSIDQVISSIRNLQKTKACMLVSILKYNTWNEAAGRYEYLTSGSGLKSVRDYWDIHKGENCGLFDIWLATIIDTLSSP